jgi:transposase
MKIMCKLALIGFQIPTFIIKISFRQAFYIIIIGFSRLMSKKRTKRAKSIQIPARDMKILLRVLTMLFVLVKYIAKKHRCFKLIVHLIDKVIDILKMGEPTKDSSNSNLPPNKDLGGSKPAKIKDKKKRKKGGQVGHKGTTIEDPGPANKTVYLTPDRDELEQNPAWRKIGTETRKVVDAKLEKEITEYIVDIYENIETGEKVSGEFPEKVTANIQYGIEVEVLVVYLRDHLHIPYNKISAFFKESFNISLSESTATNIVYMAEHSPILDIFEEKAEEAIIEAPRANADETSLSVNGKNFWVHVLSIPCFILFFLHPSRGSEAMKEFGLLAKLVGYLVTDSWKSYFMFENVKHCLCNAHILRELELARQMGQEWAIEMAELLLDILEQVEWYGGALPLALQVSMRTHYREIIARGYKATGGLELPRPPGQRGKMKQPKYRNLLERLDRFEDAVLRFMTSEHVPFSNNDAERPIRMIKVHMKIIGCFRNVEFARGFCRMRSYIVSAERNGLSACKAVRLLVTGITPDFISDKEAA